MSQRSASPSYCMLLLGDVSGWAYPWLSVLPPSADPRLRLCHDTHEVPYPNDFALLTWGEPHPGHAQARTTQSGVTL
jgi:hypothetical protein